MHECESVAVENVESEEMATEEQSPRSVKYTVLTMVFTFGKYMSSLEGNLTETLSRDAMYQKRSVML